MNRLACALVLTLFAVACGDSDDDDDDHPTPGDHDDTGTDDGGGSGGGDGGGGDDTGPPPVFKPFDGHWVFSGGALVSDSCQVDADELPAGKGDGFGLTNRAESLFTMLLDGSTDGIDCTLADMDYTCSPAVSSEDIDDWDVTIISTVTVTGAFSDRANTTSRYVIDIDCTGSDCDLAEFYADTEFPCQVQLDAVASKQE